MAKAPDTNVVSFPDRLARLERLSASLLADSRALLEQMGVEPAPSDLSAKRGDINTAKEAETDRPHNVIPFRLTHSSPRKTS